jgi:hypothetical protein
VADGPAQYVEQAVRLGTDREYRAAMRARIAAASPVRFEDLEVVHEHERFFEDAIATARAGPPQQADRPIGGMRIRQEAKIDR